jgi:hypothetical protein
MAGGELSREGVSPYDHPDHAQAHAAAIPPIKLLVPYPTISSDIPLVRSQTSFSLLPIFGCHFFPERVAFHIAAIRIEVALA